MIGFNGFFCIALWRNCQRQNRFCKPYISYVNGVSINGASLTKMLSDKIYAISGERVCRRMKDVKNKPDFCEVYDRVNNVICKLGKETPDAENYI